MIDSCEPVSWRDLQNAVARILHESGVVIAVEKIIQTARGQASIDVWAHDAKATPTQTYLVECKRWRARVPQTVVHAFRTIVGDSGANWGAIISARGFQKGARLAAEFTNVRLLSWREFQELYTERWLLQHFLREIAESTDPLTEYTEPINSRIFRKADLLPKIRRLEFRRLRNAYLPLGLLCMSFRADAIGALHTVLGVETKTALLGLPLRKTMETDLQTGDISVADEILDADSYRQLLESIVRQAQVAIAQFDEVFGERA